MKLRYYNRRLRHKHWHNRERNTTVLHQHMAISITYEAEHMEKALAVAQSYVGNSHSYLLIFQMM